jgi:uroporphyrin-III C-methyltransferase
VNHAIIFVTGHADGDFDWGALAKTKQPIVVYMAMRNVEHIVAGLIGGGLAAATPAAVIVSATTPQQRVLVCELAGLPGIIRELGFALPGLVVIGEIVAVRAQLLQLVSETGAAR